MQWFLDRLVEQKRLDVYVNGTSYSIMGLIARIGKTNPPLEVLVTTTEVAWCLLVPNPALALRLTRESPSGSRRKDSQFAVGKAGEGRTA